MLQSLEEAMWFEVSSQNLKVQRHGKGTLWLAAMLLVMSRILQISNGEDVQSRSSRVSKNMAEFSVLRNFVFPETHSGNRDRREAGNERKNGEPKNIQEILNRDDSGYEEYTNGVPYEVLNRSVIYQNENVTDSAERSESLTSKKDLSKGNYVAAVILNLKEKHAELLEDENRFDHQGVGSAMNVRIADVPRSLKTLVDLEDEGQEVEEPMDNYGEYAEDLKENLPGRNVSSPLIRSAMQRHSAARNATVQKLQKLSHKNVEHDEAQDEIFNETSKELPQQRDQIVMEKLMQAIAHSISNKSVGNRSIRTSASGSNGTMRDQDTYINRTLLGFRDQISEMKSRMRGLENRMEEVINCKSSAKATEVPIMELPFDSRVEDAEQDTGTENFRQGLNIHDRGIRFQEGAPSEHLDAQFLNSEDASDIGEQFILSSQTPDSVMKMPRGGKEAAVKSRNIFDDRFGIRSRWSQAQDRPVSGIRNVHYNRDNTIRQFSTLKNRARKQGRYLKGIIDDGTQSPSNDQQQQPSRHRPGRRRGALSQVSQEESMIPDWMNFNLQQQSYESKPMPFDPPDSDDPSQDPRMERRRSGQHQRFFSRDLGNDGDAHSIQNYRVSPSATAFKSSPLQQRFRQDNDLLRRQRPKLLIRKIDSVRARRSLQMLDWLRAAQEYQDKLQEMRKAALRTWLSTKEDLFERSVDNIKLFTRELTADEEKLIQNAATGKIPLKSYGDYYTADVFANTSSSLQTPRGNELFIDSPNATADPQAILRKVSGPYKITTSGNSTIQIEGMNQTPLDETGLDKGEAENINSVSAAAKPDEDFDHMYEGVEEGAEDSSFEYFDKNITDGGKLDPIDYVEGTNVESVMAVPNPQGYFPVGLRGTRLSDDGNLDRAITEQRDSVETESAEQLPLGYSRMDSRVKRGSDNPDLAQGVIIEGSNKKDEVSTVINLLDNELQGSDDSLNSAGGKSSQNLKLSHEADDPVRSSLALLSTEQGSEFNNVDKASSDIPINCRLNCLFQFSIPAGLSQLAVESGLSRSRDAQRTDLGFIPENHLDHPDKSIENEAEAYLEDSGTHSRDISGEIEPEAAIVSSENDDENLDSSAHLPFSAASWHLEDFSVFETTMGK